MFGLVYFGGILLYGALLIISLISVGYFNYHYKLFSYKWLGITIITTIISIIITKLLMIKFNFSHLTGNSYPTISAVMFGFFNPFVLFNFLLIFCSFGWRQNPNLMGFSTGLTITALLWFIYIVFIFN